MATLDSSLQNPGYRNWVKGCLSLKYARDGIEIFVESNIDQFHNDTLNSLATSCSNCSTENIVPCRNNNNFCQIRNKICNIHNTSDPNKKSKTKCPNSVCDKIYSAILKEHRHQPTWKNTNCRLWCKDHWQLAKCYMPEGYTSRVTASDTDFPGFLGVIINNKIFDNQVTVNLSSRNNVFCKARDVRNSILHKADMKLTDQELKDYITIFDTMLSDSKCLAVNPNAMKAKLMLDKILKGQINVSAEDEREVRALREMETKQQEILTNIESSKLKATESIKVETDDAITAVKTEVKGAETIIQEIRLLKTVSQDCYEERKKDMRTELIALYHHDEQMSAPLFPIVKTEHKNIDKMYVQPIMKIEDKTIKSYAELFKAKENKSIYVVGDAGLGKTSLCQKLVSIWCKVHSKKRGTSVCHKMVSQLFGKKTKSPDQQALAKYDFLFYISLREANADNDVIDMIKHQLLEEKHHEDLPHILKNEKCLILLDGLDEWSRENTKAKRQNKGIPGRTSISFCTILTTSRPWKLEAIKLQKAQIQTKVELQGLAKDASEQLILIMFHHLDKNSNTHLLSIDFMAELEYKELEHFMAMPAILKQLVCLWHSDKQLGETKCSIYCEMIELLLELSQTRLNIYPKYKKKKDEWIKSTIKLPSCFDEKEKCQEFKPLLFALAKLAFYSLFNENQESSLEFKKSAADIHEMTKLDRDISLKIGILTQSGIIKKCTAQKKISFLHKSYQDFLAALFVSIDQTESEQSIQTMQKTCNSINKYFEMQNTITFLIDMSPEKVCAFMSQERTNTDDKQVYEQLQDYLIDCLKEGWCCSHDNEHLQCQCIRIQHIYKPDHLELLCQANINNMKRVYIATPPTIKCLEYLLKMNKLQVLSIGNISDRRALLHEDDVYSLIDTNCNTLTDLYLLDIIFTSTRLSTVLQNVPHLGYLYINGSHLSQQQLDSLEDLKVQRPHIDVEITNSKIKPPTSRSERWFIYNLPNTCASFVVTTTQIL